MDGFIKLADMGAARGTGDDGNIGGTVTDSATKTAKATDPTRGRRMTITGTHGYRAPEVYERDYGKGADWWNVGILIIEMVTSENPLRGENRRESEYLTKHKEPQLPSYIHADAKDVALALLAKDVAKRLACGGRGAAEVKEHHFFNPIDWDKLMAMVCVHTHPCVVRVCVCCVCSTRRHGRTRGFGRRSHSHSPPPSSHCHP